MGGTTPAPLRAVFYSHDAQGLGHFSRNTALAHSLVRELPGLTGRPVTGLLINGVPESDPDNLPEGFDVVTLPSVCKHGRQYDPRRLDLSLDTVTSLRSDIIRTTLTSFAPDLVIVDRHALGIDGELLPALRKLRRKYPQVALVLGMREVLDNPQVAAREWDRVPPAIVRELYDEIWVYGDATVHDLRETGEIPAELHDMVRYQGYLSTGRSTEQLDCDLEKPFLLTTAGGGSDGFDLCLAAARSKVPHGYRQVLVTGPQMPEEQFQQVTEAARKRTLVMRQLPDVAGPLHHAEAAIAMAGYNTVTEVLATTSPALLVPREWPRTEQLIRATGLAKRGAVDLLRQEDLGPKAISEWWHRAVGTRVSREHLALDGLQTVAHSAADIVARCTQQEESLAG